MALSPKEIAETYGYYAREYDNFANSNQWRGPYYVAETIKRLAGHHVSPILDIGGGTGLTSEFLRQDYPEAHITALDLSLPMLKVAHDASRVDACVQGYAQHLPFADKSFGVVVLVGMLNYSEPDTARIILKEACRVLRPGGILAGTCLMDTYGPAPTYIAHVTHSEHYIMASLAPHPIIHNQREITRVKNGKDIEENIFAAMIR